MDLSRKRYLSERFELPAKMCAPSAHTMPIRTTKDIPSTSSLVDQMTNQLLTTLVMIDFSQRGPFLDDLLAKIQCLKAQLVVRCSPEKPMVDVRSIPINPIAQLATCSTSPEQRKDMEEEKAAIVQRITDAFGGRIRDDLLQEYLKHPIIVLRENGVVKSYANPFISNHTPTVPIKNVEAPPILLPQVANRMLEIPKVRPCNQSSVITVALPLRLVEKR